MDSDDFWLAFIGIMLGLAALIGIGQFFSLPWVQAWLAVNWWWVVLLVAALAFAIIGCWRWWRSEEQTRYRNRRMREDRRQYQQARQDLIDLHRETIRRLR